MHIIFGKRARGNYMRVKTIARKYLDYDLPVSTTTYMAMYSIEAIMTTGLTPDSLAYLFRDGSALFEWNNVLYEGTSEWKGDHHLHTLGLLSWRSDLKNP